MATKRTRPAAHPPGRAAEPGPEAPAKTGQGAKYALVRAVLGVEPLPWIQQRRKPTWRHPDGTRRQMSFRELSEEITKQLQAAGHDGQFVTIETVARWCRLAPRD